MYPKKISIHQCRVAPHVGFDSILGECFDFLVYSLGDCQYTLNPINSVLTLAAADKVTGTIVISTCGIVGQQVEGNH